MFAGTLLPGAEPRFAQLVAEFAVIAEAAGTRDFYNAALTALGRLMNCDRQIAMRYSQYARPEFLVNKSLGQEAEAIYLKGLYRLDPILRLVRTQVHVRVFSTMELQQEEPGNVYFEDLYRSAGIQDELVVLLPAAGGIWVALCLDFGDRPFSKAEMAFVAQIYPFLERIHELHIDCCLSGRRGGFLSDGQLAVMVLDAQGFVCFRNAIWSTKVSAAAENAILNAAERLPEGLHSVSDTDVVHWQILGSVHAVAPGGRIFVLERRSPGHVELDIANLLQTVAAEFQLTPRECDIVLAGLRGRSTQAIARDLNISTGTIRNHKHRLYQKLDVTSEREIASLILSRVFKAS